MIQSLIQFSLRDNAAMQRNESVDALDACAVRFVKGVPSALPGIKIGSTYSCSFVKGKPVSGVGR
jgi:hypothetical protein